MIGRSFRRRFAPVATWIIASLFATNRASAQDGGLILLLPFGARAVALGEAVSADSTLGAESMWWNVAALGRLTHKEVTFHYADTFIAKSGMLSLVVPSNVIGTIAFGSYIVDYGDQDATDPNGGATVGNITNRSYMLIASYGTPVGKRLSVGVSAKFVMLRAACSGACGTIAAYSGQTSAFDAGVQYVLPTQLPITIGGSVRNIGPALQVKDRPQADPLPKIVQFGAMSRLPIKALTDGGASLDVSADYVVASTSIKGADFGIGATLGYRDQYFLRVGYKQLPGEQSGPSLGFSLQRAGYGLDFSRRFDRLSSASGTPPTYIALRASF